MADKRTYELTEQITLSENDCFTVDKLGNSEAKYIRRNQLRTELSPVWANITFSTAGITKVYGWYERGNSSGSTKLSCCFTYSGTNAEKTVITNVTSSQNSGVEHQSVARIKLGSTYATIGVNIYNNGGTIEFIFTPTLGTGTYTVWIDAIIP